ncbi:hypothetical protein [Streptomyces fungicidicus]|uniref:hypothetical protein n=1 Tax=Streptomyces fungicidicus TaxID=68203 RepID=UPI00381EDCB0
MLIAESWYESASFWQFVITTLVAMAIGALGAFATLRASNPKRRLSYRTLINTSLLATSTRQASHLSVTHGGTVLQRPRLIEVELRNTGRRDITAAMFHGGDPIRIDLGVDVIAVLDVEVDPDSTTPPRVVAAGTSVEVHPTLLARRQTVVISILVDGRRSELACQVPLVDVQIRQAREPGDLNSAAASRLAMRVGVAGGVLSTLALLGSQLGR